MRARPRVRIWAAAVILVTVSALVSPYPPGAGADGNEGTTAPLAFRSITAGTFHTCGLLPSGRVKCWGIATSGQLGQDSLSTVGDGPGEMAALAPVNLGVGRTATAITAGSAHTCALLDDATVKCWGDGANGRLGQDSTAIIGDTAGEMAALAPVNLGVGRTATAVSAGLGHTCALLDDATVKCWGFGANGELGNDGTATLGDAPGEMAALAPVNLGVGRTATAISAGNSHTCALLDDATVKCWGSGSQGRLGQDSVANLGDSAGEMAGLAPVILGVGRTATAISAASNHTCALLDDATVKCWGFGSNGRLGQDSAVNLGDSAGEMAGLAPVNLGVGRTATGVSAGGGHTCAVLDDATVKCWGAGGNGELGQDSSLTFGDAVGEMAALPAVNLGVGRTATAVTTGHAHSCALLDDGTLKCWGANSNGELGQGVVQSLGDAAGEMASLSSVNLGVPLSVRLRADQHAVVPGQAIDYHLTIANETSSTTLTGITVIDPNAPDCVEAVPALAAGQTHTIDCSYTPTGADFPSRANTATVDTDQTDPLPSNQVDVAVGSPAGATAVAVGTTHSCAIVDDGSVRCWGDGGSGRLGQGSTVNLGAVPGDMAALPAVNLGVGRTAAAIAAGGAHTCAVLDNATVKCWGQGAAGQLGQDSNTNLGDAPGEMAALPAVNLGVGRTATAVAVGSNHTCALLDDATVKCWGGNAAGQLGQDSNFILGDASGEMAALPAVNLGAGRTATAIAAGDLYSCALLDDATVKCWGFGANGRLGTDGTANLGDASGEMAALAPVNLGAGRTATGLSAGSRHACAVLDDATAKCWGFGGNGELGQDSTLTLGDAAGEMAALPAVNLGVGRTATTVAAGGAHTCAVLDNATVRCWGSGANGRLGRDSTSNAGVLPGEMAALSAVNLGVGRTATSIATGLGSHSCALLDDDSVKCWGLGSSGQLGQDSVLSFGDDPGEMAALPPVLVGIGPGAPALAVSLAADESSVVATQDIHYQLTLTNAGVPTLTGITVSDPNAPDCVVAVPDLSAGEDHTIDCSYTTTLADIGTYSNVATVDAAETAPVVSNQVDVTVLEPPTGVSGSVTELGSGDPVGGAWLAVLKTSDFSIEAGAVADGSGGFSALVPPGSYFVYVVDPSGVHPAGFHGPPTMVTVTSQNMTDVDPVLATTRGSLAGTVTEEGSGDPIGGAWALSLSGAIESTGALELLSTADGAGVFSLAGLRAGNHYLAAVDPSGGHETRFFPDSPNVPDASQVAVTAGNVTPVDMALPAQGVAGTGAVVSGTVTEEGTGDPLSGVRVVALRASDFAMVRGATTNGSGVYSLDVPAGGYKLAIFDSAGLHAMEWFDDLPSTDLGSAVTVTAPGVADAALDATTGQMVGTVTDDPSADPVAGAWVIAIGPSGIAGGAVTAVDGTYTIVGLAPGTYRATVADPNGGRVQEYWDDSLDYDGATTFNITAAGTATIDTALALPPP